jgi:hypothetical protein
MIETKPFNVHLAVLVATVQTARMGVVELHCLHLLLSMALDVTVSRGLVEAIQLVVVEHHET